MAGTELPVPQCWKEASDKRWWHHDGSTLISRWTLCLDSVWITMRKLLPKASGFLLWFTGPSTFICVMTHVKDLDCCCHLDIGRSRLHNRNSFLSFINYSIWYYVKAIQHKDISPLALYTMQSMKHLCRNIQIGIWLNSWGLHPKPTQQRTPNSTHLAHLIPTYIS